MIGHFLLTLSEEREGWALTKTMRPGAWESPCLLGVTYPHCTVLDVALPKRGIKGAGLHVWQVGTGSVARRYDALCHRFGTPRVNSAIRNRILSNRARRTLQNRPVETHVRNALEMLTNCGDDKYLIGNERRVVYDAGDIDAVKSRLKKALGL